MASSEPLTLTTRLRAPSPTRICASLAVVPLLDRHGLPSPPLSHHGPPLPTRPRSRGLTRCRAWPPPSRHRLPCRAHGLTRRQAWPPPSRRRIPCRARAENRREPPFASVHLRLQAAASSSEQPQPLRSASRLGFASSATSYLAGPPPCLCGARLAPPPLEPPSYSCGLAPNHPSPRCRPCAPRSVTELPHRVASPCGSPTPARPPQAGSGSSPTPCLPAKPAVYTKEVSDAKKRKSCSSIWQGLRGGQQKYPLYTYKDQKEFINITIR